MNERGRVVERREGGETGRAGGWEGGKGMGSA